MYTFLKKSLRQPANKLNEIIRRAIAYKKNIKIINCTNHNNVANVSILNMLYNVTTKDVIRIGVDIMFNYMSL